MMSRVSPISKTGGIKCTSRWTKESPTYFYATTAPRTAGDQGCLDLGFWKPGSTRWPGTATTCCPFGRPPIHLDGHMEDEYPGIAINGVTGVDEAGRSVKVNNMTIEKKSRIGAAS